jgi:hypothetical protein
MILYTSIENLPLYNFDKYRNTQDLNWFIEGFDGRQKKIDDPQLKEVEKAILDEYFKAIDDRSFTNKLQKSARIEELKTKYFIVKSLINRLWIGFGKDQSETRYQMIKELERHGFKMPLINTLSGDKEECLRLNTACEGLKTKIGILQNELNKERKIESISLMKQIQIATIGLQYPQRINPKQTTVEEWIEICKLLEEKTKQN